MAREVESLRDGIPRAIEKERERDEAVKRETADEWKWSAAGREKKNGKMEKWKD